MNAAYGLQHMGRTVYKYFFPQKRLNSKSDKILFQSDRVYFFPEAIQTSSRIH